MRRCWRSRTSCIADRPDTQYVDHIYGQKELGGTSVLYLSAVPFEKLGFPTYGEKPFPAFTKTALGAITFRPSLAVGTLLGAAYAYFRKRNSGFRGLLPPRLDCRAMRGMGLLAGAAATAFTVIGSSGAAVPAQASNYGFEINGTYRATSIGELARTSEVFIDEQTTVETWTVNSSCTDPWTCTWPGDERPRLDRTAGGGISTSWLVDREIPNWEPCPDGTTATGYQKYYFYGKEPERPDQ